MPYGKSLVMREIQVVKLFTSNPEKAVRLSRDGSEVVKYPDGTKYVWHNGSRRRIAR